MQPLWLLANFATPPKYISTFTDARPSSGRYSKAIIPSLIPQGTYKRLHRLI